MEKKQKGGVNITKSDIKARDIVGRDKIEYGSVTTFDQDEKSSWILFLERGGIFLWTISLGGVMLGGLGYGIVSLTGGDGVIGTIVGVVLAFLFAIAAAGNVSRYRA